MLLGLRRTSLSGVRDTQTTSKCANTLNSDIESRRFCIIPSVDTHRDAVDLPIFFLRRY
jgi:hypothetical protein